MKLGWEIEEVNLALTKALYFLRKLEVHPYIGVEIEFYLRDEFQKIPKQNLVDRFASFIPELRLEAEKGKGQYEYAMDFCAPYQAILNANLLKKKIINAANRAGLEAILAAKPFDDDYGSAMHLHLSLHDKLGNNLFSIEEGYMEGVIYNLLKLLETDLAFICSSDDLMRLEPKWMAPSHLSWGGNNRSVAVRIPDGQIVNKRLEFRVPSANACIRKSILFLLTSLLFDSSTNSYERIYGNAWDEQYNLPRLCFYNKVPKYFNNFKNWDNLLNKVKVYG